MQNATKHTQNEVPVTSGDFVRVSDRVRVIGSKLGLCEQIRRDQEIKLEGVA